MANTQMARRYGLPCTVTCIATGSKAPDWQAGVQSMATTMANMLMPADMLNGVGSLYGDSSSPRSSCFWTPSFRDALDLTKGFRFSAEDIALDAIPEVGPGGHFLDSEHTLTNMRAFWRDSLMDRKYWDAWEEAGRPDPAEPPRTRRAGLRGT